ncbi:MAG: acyl-CoA/acyl-ACP dehydrogenase [Ectothiorhodospiraceae bacterium]|nr:acyl-CoA/acyl-ACP dehydrogenase [Ectothiorhodospiraceae bacterium]
MNDSADELRMLADSVVQFARNDDTLTRTRALHKGGAAFSRETWSTLADAGWLGILVPEDSGGLGLGLREMAVVAEELGRARIPEPVVAVAGFTASVLSACDRKAAASELLSELASGATIAAVAWQEDPTDLDPATTHCRATHEGNAIVLNGSKCLVLPAEADVFLVSSETDEGVALYSVPSDAPGLALERRQQVDGSWVADLRLDNVSVSADQMLASPGQGLPALERGLARAALLAGAELTGLAHRLLGMTNDYLATRKQFGQPLSSFQALRHRAVDLYIQPELMQASLRHAFRTLRPDSPLALEQRLAARVKARTSDAAMRIGRESVQLHGAIGFTEEADVGIHLKRIMALSAWLGNAAWQRRRHFELSRNTQQEVA